MTIKEFFSFRKNRFFWMNLLLMVLVVILLIFGLFFALDKYTLHGRSVEVPDVKGMSVSEARLVFKSRNLKAEVVDSSYVKELVPGKILEQNPAKGAKVKEGRVIYLTINTLSIPLQVVPDVADNSSLRQAQAKLKAAGFKLTEEEYIDGEKDWVYGVKYNGKELDYNEKVPIGATLTLMVGKGTYLMPEIEPGFREEIIIENEPTSEPIIVEDAWF